MNLFAWARRRAGRLPAELRSELEAEGVLVLAEELPGTLTLRNYRAPWRYTSASKETVTGAVGVTDKRLVVWAQGRSVLDVPRLAGQVAKLEVAAEGADTIFFGFAAEDFHADRSGRVEFRFCTIEAARIAELLGARG
ncbi:hypothetical protein [Nocardia sp. NPDC051832]|uniref:hypothetical protein n=1 Tax=Nocardia sp. NPDC051832 TaxID=3155673 RepID=UPI003427E81C